MWRLKEENGAVLIVVVLTIVILVGMAALVVDAGAMYEERRELQNGADAAALAVAENCARGLACTLASANTTADELANANAEDGSSTAVIEAAAFDPDGEVTVETSTAKSDGTTAVSFVFEPVLDLIGGDDADGKTIYASATAVWGSPSWLTTIPLTVSKCEWQSATGNGELYESQTGGYSDSDADGAREQTLLFHDGSSRATCGAVAGMDADEDGKLPAGFGWLVPDGGACTVTTSTVDGTDDEWAVKDPGVDTECQADRMDDLLGEVVGLPIFEDFCRSNEDGCPDLEASGDKYRVFAYSGLYVTGYDLGGPAYERYDPATRTSAPDCGTRRNDDRCITGYFTQTVGPGGGGLGGLSAGVLVIELTN